MPSITELDRRILRQLQRNARISNVELAERVNLSPSACLRRVRALEDSGYIDGYVTLLNRKALNLTGTAWIFIRLERQSQEMFKRFEQEIKEIPEVMECHLMTGDADFMLKVAFDDSRDFERVYLGRLLNLPAVVGTNTRLVMRTVYQSTELPI